MQFTIFANGKINTKTTRIPQQSKVIAADGGAQNCLNFGIKPQVVIGDLDSINPSDLARLEAEGVKIIHHPEDKNETDLELAINFAAEAGATKITLLGLLGGRWDMSFANVMLLASPQYSKIKFHVIGDHLEMFILRGKDSITLDGKPDEPISVLPLGGNASGVTYQGLAWSLKDAEIPFGSPIGVSNNMLEDEATISLDSGVLLIIHGFSDVTEN